ncbi:MULTISPECIES: hypothetical protein [Metallosphaera]|nr:MULTISPECIES: hypothetical protein [Metallosphaera]MCY0860938.1 hypothetical protein [Metallosphaera prunae]WPX07389.1 hypothetical protein SOJ17_001154 [Metallosphaera sedula DSM 5348]BBL47239.1 hypothetical protein MJ1HA_1340 [Metallosphaera sedula]
MGKALKEQIKRREEEDVRKALREILLNLDVSDDEWTKAVRDSRNER